MLHGLPAPRPVCAVVSLCLLYSGHQQCKVYARRLPAKVQALFRHLHEEKGYGTLTLLAGGLAVPLLTGDSH